MFPSVSRSSEKRLNKLTQQTYRPRFRDFDEGSMGLERFEHRHAKSETVWISVLPCRAKELISLTSGLLLSFFLYTSDNCTTHCPSLKVMWFFSFFQPGLRTLVQHRKPMTHEGTGQSVMNCLQHVVRFCPQPREKNPESFDSKRGTKRWRVRTPQTLSTVCRRIRGKTKLRILMHVEKSWQMKSNSVGRCNNRGILSCIWGFLQMRRSH